MPRKSKPPKTHAVIIAVGDRTVRVKLHPPTGSRAAWYAYWSGQTASRSTRATTFDAAVKAVETLLTGRPAVPTVVAPSTESPEPLAPNKHAVSVALTDDEFVAVQRAYFDRRTDPVARLRAKKTLAETMDAISAFKTVSRLDQICGATPDDCAAFQRKALTLSKNWRAKHPKSKPDAATVSPNTVIKWCL